MPPPPPPPSSGGTPPPPPPTYSGAPPGFAAYNTNPVAGFAKGIGGLAKALQIVMVVAILGNILGIVVTLGQRNTLVDFVNGDGVSRAEARDAINAISGAGAIGSLATLAAVVLTMIWMYRLAVNHRLFGRPGSTWAPLWGVFGWFLPPVLFVIPWLMFGELWRGSAPGLQRDDPNWKRTPIGPIVHIWWVIYGIGGIAVAAVQFTSISLGGGVDDVAEFYDDSIALIMASTVVQIASGLAFIVLVRRLTARQQVLIGR